MALLKEEKAKVISDFQRAANDTGSPEIQIAMLTQEITELTTHLKVHKKDFHSQRGLMQKVGQRKRLMQYLERENHAEYRRLIDRLGIRG